MRDLKKLIADLQALLDGYRRQGHVEVQVCVKGATLLTLKIPLPRD